MEPERPYRGVPLAERRARRRGALVEAALDLLHEGGLAAVGVRAVCVRSRLTPRYFYENFVDLDELLVAAVDTANDEVSARVLAAVHEAGPSTAAQVRTAVSIGFGVVVDDPRAASVFLAAAGGQGPLRERRHEIVARYADLAVATLSVLDPGTAGDTDTDTGTDARAQARATALFLMGGTTDLFEAVLSGRLQMTRERVVDQVTALWLGALAAYPGTRDGADRPD